MRFVMHWSCGGGCAQAGFVLSTNATVAASTNVLMIGFRLISLLLTFVSGAPIGVATLSANARPRRLLPCLVRRVSPETPGAPALIPAPHFRYRLPLRVRPAGPPDPHVLSRPRWPKRRDRPDSEGRPEACGS